MAAGWGCVTLDEPLYVEGKLKMGQARKLHKWQLISDYHLKPRDMAKFNISHGFDFKICKTCGLQKFSKRYAFSDGGKFETYYFTADENGNIIEDTFKKGTLPYSCGYKEKMMLTDKDFEIDI